MDEVYHSTKRKTMDEDRDFSTSRKRWTKNKEEEFINDFLEANKWNNDFWYEVNTKQFDQIQDLPFAVYKRLKMATSLFNVHYFHRSGIFVADSLVAEDQKGVFSLRQFDYGDTVGKYTGVVFDSTMFDAYFAVSVNTYLEKERYLFGYGNNQFMDPTDFTGQLYPVEITENILPLVNEPPTFNTSNCIAHISKKLSKEITFFACQQINPFEELYIRYDGAEDESSDVIKYTKRNYAVGKGCAAAKSAQFMTSPVNFEEIKQEEEKNQALEHRAKVEERNRLLAFVQNNRDLVNKFLRPIVKKNDSSSSSPDEYFVWRELKVKQLEENRQLEGNQLGVFAQESIASGTILFIFGLALSKELYERRLSTRSVTDMFGLASGWLDCDRNYDPYHFVGGKGLFIAALVRTQSSFDSFSYGNKPNMRLQPEGYYQATRTIKRGEELLAFPNERSKHFEEIAEQLSDNESFMTTF